MPRKLTLVHTLTHEAHRRRINLALTSRDDSTVVFEEGAAVLTRRSTHRGCYCEEKAKIRHAREVDTHAQEPRPNQYSLFT